MAGLKLNRDDVINLINIYNRFDCLWNYKSPNYNKNDIKSEAWREIAYKFNGTTDEIKKKIKYLRAAYLFEKKKVDDSKRSGSSGTVYKPSLFYYDQFRFLDSAIYTRPKANDPEKNDQNKLVSPEHLECTDTPTYFPSRESYSETPSHKRKCVAAKPDAAEVNKFEQSMDSVANFAVTNNSPPQPDDMFTLFGKSIASQLKNLPLHNASTAMAQIQQIITEHTIEVLSQSQHCYNPNVGHTSSDEAILVSNSDSFTEIDDKRFIFDTSMSSSSNTKKSSETFE